MLSPTIGVRRSPLAGQWYPADAKSLGAMVDRYLDSVEVRQLDGHIVGLMAPHAGLRFSGPVAAHAYAQVKGKTFDTVVVIGPMHYPLHGALLTSAHSAYQTPLGLVDVDRESIEVLGRHVQLTFTQDDPEHSVEIELPFLQRVLQPGFKFIPLMLRHQSEEQALTLGAALAETLRGRKVLFIASSDLSHFQVQAVANELDRRMLDCVISLDAHQVVAANEMGTAVACGYGAIASVIQAVRAWDGDLTGTTLANTHAEIVGYATSGDVTGAYSRVVGYGAVVFWKTALTPA